MEVFGVCLFFKKKYLKSDYIGIKLMPVLHPFQNDLLLQLFLEQLNALKYFWTIHQSPTLIPVNCLSL